MTNTPTTPASVASRLTDEEILKLAELCEFTALSESEERYAASVLRDYMRLRKLVNAVEDAFVKFAVQYEYSTIENADTRDMGREELADDENWQALKRLMMEAEKGKAE